MTEQGRLLARSLDSSRMRLVAATVRLVEADLAGGAQLAAALGAQAHEEWPPELYDRLAVEYSLQQLQDKAEQGWSTWYLISKSPLVMQGVCGFKARPDEQGSVEISYSILPSFRNQGLASEAVSTLVQWAFTHLTVQEVSAETFPHLIQSIKVLEKNGFQKTGRGSEYGVVRYAIGRQALS